MVCSKAKAVQVHIGIVDLFWAQAGLCLQFSHPPLTFSGLLLITGSWPMWAPSDILPAFVIAHLGPPCGLFLVRVVGDGVMQCGKHQYEDFVRHPAASVNRASPAQIVVVLAAVRRRV